ncbi:hypothetical protein HMPREF1546_02177 [Oscillibacter sp. KLE 1745]|nr:hypothetical protein HMPREF1546_02177 [Oscillibacter sp. KLE 1745]
MIPSSTWRLKPILKKRGQSDAVREEIDKIPREKTAADPRLPLCLLRMIV